MLGNRWVILAVLFLARTAMGFQFQSVAALSTFLITDLDIDYTQLGLLIGVYLLPGIVIAYPGGLLGLTFRGQARGARGLDPYGHRRSIDRHQRWLCDFFRSDV